MLLLPFILLIVLAVGAVLFRAAVSLANKVLGPVVPATNPGEPLPVGPLGTEPQSSAIGKPAAASENPFATQTKIPTASSTDDGNPYAAPSVFASAGVTPTIAPKLLKAIPEPSFSDAMVIVFLQGLAIGMLNFLASLLSYNIHIDAILPMLGSFLLGLLLTLAIYAWRLPTSFGKAALVYLFQVLIASVLAIGIALMVFAVTAIFQGVG